MRYYYAGVNRFGTEFEYDSSWEVVRFNSRQERDTFILDVNRAAHEQGKNDVAESITRRIAKRITGSRTCLGSPVYNDAGEIVGHTLVYATSYVNPHFWD